MVKQKNIGLKLSVENDKKIDLIAQKRGVSKSQIYREIIDEYFKTNPLTESEEDLIKSMNM